MTTVDVSQTRSDSVPAPLRIMVCPHEMVTGGSQINAIDLAAEMQARGHVVEVYAPAGPLVPLLHARGLMFVAAPQPRGGFDTRFARAFAGEVRRFRPDIVHAYESRPTIASVLASLTRAHRLVVTVLSMSVPEAIPGHVPLVVGTRALADGLRLRRGPVHLIEPPIDVDHDAPADTRAARAALKVGGDGVVVAVVGRLSFEHHKARGVAHAIDALAGAPRSKRVTLLVAGSGDEEHLVQEAATRAALSDTDLDVRLLGNVEDPRVVYDAADIVFGMGGSALRAMSHCKPLVIQGREGYWELLSPQSLGRFLNDGFFGQGESGGPGIETLVEQLAADPEERARLGKFGRTLVLERFALTRAADRLEKIYEVEMTAHHAVRVRALESTRSIARHAKFLTAVRWPRLRRAYRSLTGRHG